MSRIELAALEAAVRALPEQVTRELRSRLRQLPVALRRGGLAPTLASLLARQGDPHNATIAREITRIVDPDTTPEALLESLTSASNAHYVAASRRAELAALWLKRLAEARYDAAARPDPVQTDPSDDSPRSPAAKSATGEGT